MSSVRVSLRREKIHNALDGLVRIVGVQRGQAEVPRFRKGDGGLHGFCISYLTDYDHVWSLTHGVPQGFPKGMGIEPHFPLVNDRLLMTMYKLDWVLNGYDMSW